MSWRKIVRLSRTVRGDLRGGSDEESASDILLQITLPMVIVLAVWTLALAEEAKRKREDIDATVGQDAQREYAGFLQELQRMRLLKALEQYLAQKREELGVDDMPASAIIDRSGRVSSKAFKDLSEKANTWMGPYEREPTCGVVSEAYRDVLEQTSEHASDASDAFAKIVDCERTPSQTAATPAPCAQRCALEQLGGNASPAVIEEVFLHHRTGREKGSEEILEKNRKEICAGIIRGLDALYERITVIQRRVTDELAGIYISKKNYKDELLRYNENLRTIYEAAVEGKEGTPLRPGSKDPFLEQVRVALRCQLHCQNILLLPDKPKENVVPCAQCDSVE